MRDDLIGCMCAVTGRQWWKAMWRYRSLCSFYTTSMKRFAEIADVDIAPKGTI